MDGQAENVIVMPQVEPLRVLLPAVHHGNSGDVVHHFSGLCVEQVVPAVVAPVTEAQRVTEQHADEAGQATVLMRAVSEAQGDRLLSQHLRPDLQLLSTFFAKSNSCASGPSTWEVDVEK